MEATTSFSLSLSHSHYTVTLCTLTTTKVINTIHKMFFALSHIYTYMTFGLFTHVSLTIDQTVQRRVLDHPVLTIFHPEGTVSQQTPPSLWHGMSGESDPLSACVQLVGCQYFGQHV